MRLLLIEDNPDDVELISLELRRYGLEFEHRVVETREMLLQALEEGPWAAILSDFHLPRFSVDEALELVRARDHDVPFVVVSGTIGEEKAVDLIRAGASDYVWKDRLARLGPSLERELRDVHLRAERRSLFDALRRSEDRYRRVFDKAPLGIAVSMRDGLILNANERLAEIFDQPRAAIAGRRLDEFRHPEELPLGHVGDTGRTHFEKRYIRGNGEIVWTSITLAPVADDHGALEQIVWLVEDVTARKSAEERLALQAHLLDSVEQAVIATDRAGTVMYWNRCAEKLYGWPAAEALGRHILDMTPSLQTSGASQSIVEQLMRGEPWSGELLLEKRDGTLFPAYLTDAPFYDAQGTLVGIVGVSHDVSERRRSEEALRSSREQLAQAQAIAHVGSYEYDMLTGRRTWSDEMFRIYGFEVAEEVDMKAADDRIHPDDYELVMARRNRTVAQPDAFAGDHRIVLPNGEVRTLHGRGRCIRDAEGRPVKIIGVMQDVTETRAQQRELQKRALQQSAIAELSRLAMKTTDASAFTRACELVTTRLGAAHSLFFELDAADWLRPVAAAHEVSDAAGIAEIAGSAQVLESAAWQAPVVVDDYAADTRHAEAPRLVERGIRSGIAVPVVSATATLGVLTAYATRPRHFAQADVHFVEGLANILAEALERDRAQRELVASEERYRAVIEGASEVIFSVTPDGVFTSLNPAFEWVTGFATADWLGRSWLELLHPDDRQLAASELRAATAMEEPVMAELALACRRGRIVIEVSMIARVRNGVTFVHGFARDVSEARRAERERQQLTRNLQLLLESTAEGIITTDLEGRCTMVNAAAARMLGSSTDALLHSDIGAWMCDAAGRIAAVAETGQVWSSATDEFVRSDLTPFPVEYSVAPIVDQGCTVGLVIGFTDITERRKLEGKLEQANRIASLGRLAATVAHEFNNVLMGISPFVEVLRRGKNVEASLDHIGRAVKRGKRVTEDILRFTQPAEPVRVALEVLPWLQNIALEARSLLTPTCQLEIDVADPALRIDGDPNQLQQIFTNLILNARDAMPNGGLLSVDVRRERAGASMPFGVVEHPERFAHFVVTDTGCGMPEETLRHIFEPLFTTKRNGTGLGIPVALQVVQRHGGDMFVESTPGIGTTFHIFLPLTESLVVPQEADGAEEERTAAARRVLLVEDDPTVALGLVSLLELEGMSVQVAKNGAEALGTLRFDVPDLVVLDVGLPDMEGTSVYDQIAKTNPELPVIFSTGHADRSKIEALLTRPHVGFLLKPYDVSALLDAMREVTAAA